MYRLSGDYNPLHIDNSIAKAYGFSESIAHGLCSLGLAVRNVLAVISLYQIINCQLVFGPYLGYGF